MAAVEGRSSDNSSSSGSGDNRKDRRRRPLNPDRDQKAFLQGHKGIRKLALFDKPENFAKHTPRLFGEMGEEHMAAFLEHVTGLKRGRIARLLDGKRHSDDDDSWQDYGLVEDSRKKSKKKKKNKKNKNKKKRRQNSSLKETLNEMDQDQARRFFDRITTKDMAALRDRKACRLLGLVLDQLRGESLNGLSWDCAQALLSGITGIVVGKKRPAVAPKSMLRHFPRRHLKEHAGAIVKIAGSRLHLFSAEQIGLLVGGRGSDNGNGSNCGHIDARVLSKMDRSQASRITPKCFAKMRRGLEEGPKGMDRAQWDNLPDDLLELATQELGEGWWEEMPRAKVARLGAKLEGEGKRCKNLALELLPADALGGVTPACFWGYLRRRSDLSGLAERWKDLADDVLTVAATAESAKETLKRIGRDEWKGIRAEQLRPLLSKGSSCAALQMEDLPRGVSGVSAGCMAALKPELQVQVLAHGKDLADDLLSHIGQSQIKAWIYDNQPGLDKSGKSLEGLQVLSLLERQPNLEAILNGLSSALGPAEHGCRGIARHLRGDSSSGKRRLQGAAILLRNPSQACLTALEETIGGMAVEDLAAHAPALLALKPFKEIRGQSFWRELKTADQLRPMLSVRNGRICGEMDLETFRLIPREALEAFEGACVAKLTFHKSLGMEEWQAFGNAAFAHFDAALFGAAALQWQWLRGEQLAQMSSSIDKKGDRSSSALSLLDKPSLGKMDGLAQIAHIPREGWPHVPAAAFGGFLSPAHLSPIPGSHTRLWTVDQVRGIPLESLQGGLNADQAAQCGADLVGEEAERTSPVPYLRQVAPKLASEEARAATLARKERNAAGKVTTINGMFPSFLALLLITILNY